MARIFMRRRPVLEALEGRALLTAGALDTTFGGTGLVTTPIGPANDVANATAIDSSGRIVAVGDASNGTKNNFAVVRYLSNGALDTTFGGTGKVTTSFNSYNDQANAVAIQPDGKIVVAGFAGAKGSNFSTNPAEDFALARYNPDGTLDSTFGNGGLVTTHFSVTSKSLYVSTSSINSIVIQPDGKILVAGSSTPLVNGTQSAAFTLARYNSNGSLDTSFGNGGTVVTDLDNRSDFASFVGLQTINGVTKIVAVGVKDGATNSSYAAVLRYNMNGTLDSSFGSGGVALNGNAVVEVRGGAIQADGSILAAGWENANNEYAMGVWRFTPNGAVDTSFNGTGMASAVFGQNTLTNDDSRAYGVVVQPDGAIVVGGYATTNLTTSTGTVGVYNFGLAPASRQPANSTPRSAPTARAS